MKARKADLKMLDRLKKRSDFLRAYHAGQKWVAGSIIVQVADSPLAPPPDSDTDANTDTDTDTGANPDSGCPAQSTMRFGITVTKKISKKAVTRNRIKRRLRALCRDVLPQNAIGGKDYVIIGRATTENVSYETLLKDLKWCLKRLGCLKPQP